MPRVQQQFNTDKYRRRYLRFSLIIFLLAIIFIIWIAILIGSIYYLGYGYKYAGLTMNQWIISITGIISFFVIVELIFIIHYHHIKQRATPKIHPKQRYFKGKRLHRYSLPSDAKGGLFSNTYVVIDDRNILNLRYQVLAPEKLWNPK